MRDKMYDIARILGMKHRRNKHFSQKKQMPHIRTKSMKLFQPRERVVSANEHPHFNFLFIITS